ncbi:MAG: glycosyltransferase family 2 protein [Acholeplasmataceae bacterium]|nr:glycosyltransferase family 2 protein [Acholeplasmataceae bacterium]
MVDLTTIILTLNEELNIKECIESVQGISKRIVVIDSNSTDQTIAIAKSMGADIYTRPFINHSDQFQFGLSETNITTKWIMRLDADERLTEKSAAELEKVCNENENTNVNGVVVRFEVNFLGKKLRHGGIYPFRKLIVFKRGLGQIEKRNMDEHIYLTEGKSVMLKNDSIHNDYKDLSTYIDKHNKYATKEMKDYFIQDELKHADQKLNPTARFKRFIKYKVYYKLPMGFRAYLYYVHRYYIKLGFLDGKEGKIFAFLQAYWYRFLVDAKIYEMKKNKRGKK